MIRFIFVIAMLVSTLSAQTAYVLTRDVSTGTGPAFATWLPDAAWSSGVAAPDHFRLMMPNFVTESAAATGTPTPPIGHEGGLAIDQIAGIVYATDGTSFLSQDSHSHYSASALPATAVSLPLLGGPIGALTGLAVDPDSGLLYVCDGFSFQARSKIWPYAAATPVMPIPPFAGISGATGLGFDPSTGHLWATNVDGATVEFSLSGVPISTHPPLPGPHGFIRGLAVNPSNGVGSLPPYPGQVDGFHVCLTDGSKIHDALPPWGAVTTLASATSYCRGLAISADPSVLPGRYDTTQSNYKYNNHPNVAGLTPVASVTRPTFKGPGAFCYAMVSNVPVSGTLYLAADLSPLSTSASTPGIVVGTDVLWLNPLASTFALIPVVAGVSGDASVYLPIGLAPGGLQFCLQWLIPDPSAYLGFDFSDALQIKITER